MDKRSFLKNIGKLSFAPFIIPTKSVNYHSLNELLPKELSKKEALKGVGYATISLAIFKILTIHVLIKLFIVICVLRVVRGQKLIGYDFIKNIFNRLRITNKTKLYLDVN